MKTTDTELITNGIKPDPTLYADPDAMKFSNPDAEGHMLTSLNILLAGLTGKLSVDKVSRLGKNSIKFNIF